jgi:hypothetical protein
LLRQGGAGNKHHCSKQSNDSHMHS